MQIRNRYYPFPVIIEEGEYYPNSSFNSYVEQSIDGYNVKVLLKAELDDDKLLEMIKEGTVVYAHHIECPQTCYRTVIKTRSATAQHLLKDTDVNGIVQICSFVIADQDIEKYTNESFSSDYRGWKFNIEKGCIMAVGNQYNIRINKQRDDLADTSSIFSVVKNLDPSESMITYDLGNPKIIIRLPEITYNQYSSVQNYIDIQPVMHSMLIIPALSYAFAELRRAGENLFEYENSRWFGGLKKACAAIGISLDEETLQTIDIIRVPQLLLDSPISKAIAFCAMGGGAYED